MRKRSLVAPVCVALVTVACAGDGDDPAATDNSSVGADFAGEVTVDDVGRLQPAECSGDNVASEVDGVAEDSVNVATLSIDFAALAEIGFAASELDPTATYAAFVDEVNENGGVCGRTVDVQQVVYDVLAGEGGQACVEATEDRANLVVNTATYNEVLCLTDAGVPAYTGADVTGADLEAGGGLLFTRFPLLEDQYRATVQYALDDGALEGQVGVWYGSVFPDQGDAVEEVVLPMLDDAGVDYVPYRTDYSGPDDPQGNTVLTSAATDFAGHEVDTLLMFVQNTNHTGMETELAAQGLRPRLISAPISGNTSNELFADRFGTREIADGQEFVTFTLGATELGEEDPIAAACNEIYTRRTGETVEPRTFEYQVVTSTCVQVDVLAAALSLAGGDLTRERFVQALASLPPYRVPPLVGEVEWTADDHAGPTVFSAQTYDGGTNSVATGDDTFETGDG
jgi:ABC-type branched-subunit amino acid transport system substrate-binding protein